MPRRQKILIGLVAAMLIAYLADFAYRRLYAQPLQSAQNTSQILNKRLHKAKLNVRQERNKIDQLEDLRQRSLPSDLELAVSCYRSWLLEIIEQVGLQRTSVDSSPPQGRGNLYSRIDFTVRTNGTLQQINDFLIAFYRSGYLHKIRSMSLNPTASGAVDSTLVVEALVLPNATMEDRLSTLEASNMPLVSPEDYRVIPRRNLFAGGDPISSNLVLTAITFDAQGQPQAWLSNRAQNQTHILTTDQVLSLQGIVLRIKQIDAQHVTVELDGQSSLLSIGDSLAEAVEESP
jgi:hypothetical protein